MSSSDPLKGQFTPYRIFIAQNLSQELTISVLCRHFGLGRNNLAAFFRQHTGMTPRKYIIAARMQKAALLIQDHHKIAVVARLTGYQNTASFIRAFKQYHGSTPAGTYPE